jgi:aspartate/methionine/tyrosine aminotransferase
VKVPPFVLERWQSEWENRVSFNLSESGVMPLTLAELLDSEEGAALNNVRLGYTQTNGTLALRGAIAVDYAGATPDNVLVTTGTSEANYVALWRLLEPGDDVVAVLPNYMQLPGLVEGFGTRLTPVWLKGGSTWRIDPAELEARVGPRTKLICVCNPNNPTGSVLPEDDMDAVVAAAARHGAWILADEVYRDAAREAPRSPSFWGRYDRVLVTSGLSKAYGMPGLRIGWVVGPAELVAELWQRRDYTTISPAALSDAVATAALQPERRQRILERTRTLLRDNFAVVAEWMGRHPALSTVPPRAGAIAFLRQGFKVPSALLADRLLREQSVLIVPGEQFGMEGFLRVGFGYDRQQLRAALDRTSALFDTL